MATNTKINDREYYRIRRTIDGQVKSFYGRSKGDAEKKYREHIEKLAEEKHREHEAYDNATFGQRASEYVQTTLAVSNKFATATIYQYTSAYNKYVKDCELSNVKLSKIRPSDIQRFYNALDVSSQTMSRINKFMVNFKNWAVLNNYCTDFMSAVQTPKKPDNSRHDEIVIWYDDELASILSAMDMREATPRLHRQAFFVHLLLYTGARISEAISLRYSDLEDDVVNIQRQCYMGEIKPPKYGSSRIIPMHSELKRTLEIHKEWHKWDMQKHGYKTDLVFTASTGKMYDPRNIRRALERFYATHDIPYKHPHVYRATFCTQLCRCGVPLEVASALMGHKSMEVTAMHYALVRSDTKREAIDKLTYFDVVK